MSLPVPDNSDLWQETAVNGHPCDVFQPEPMNDHGYLVIYLHGAHASRLPDQNAFTEPLGQQRLACVAPLTQRSWWTDRICEEFDAEISAEQHLVEHIVAFCERRFGSKPPRLALLGTGMGGQGALRLAYKYPDLFPVVAAISPAIDFQSCIAQGDELLRSMYRDEEDARQDTATLHVHALNWPRHQFFCCDPTDYRWFDSSDRLHMKLSALGIPHEFDLETSHGGHGCTYYHAMASRAIEFIAQSLERERMRIV